MSHLGVFNMRIVIRKTNLRTLKERLKNETALAVLFLCVFTLLFADLFLFVELYDSYYNGEVQQCYEVYQTASVISGRDWYEERAIRIRTGRFVYRLDVLPYWTPLDDMVDEFNEALKGKRVLVRYRERLWSNRQLLGMETDEKVYVSFEDTYDLWEKRATIKVAALMLYTLIDLFFLIPMTLGIIQLKKEDAYSYTG